LKANKKNGAPIFLRGPIKILRAVVFRNERQLEAQEVLYG